MKIGKSELKALIKECLVELLAEGLGSNITEAVQAQPRSRNRDAEPLPGQVVARQRFQDPNAGRRRALDETRVVPQTRPTAAAIPPNVAALTRDPIMAAIFADTAKTTLVEQNNGVRPGDVASQAMARAEPTQMFPEEVVDKWNEAAFKPARPMGGLPSSFINELMRGDD